MKAYSYTEIIAEPVPGNAGVRIRWAIGQNVAAPNFVSRIIEIDPGASTGYHNHSWEHEVVVLEGEGTVRDANGTAAMSPGTLVYVEPGEDHEFTNNGETLLRFVCVIPYPPKS
jgi:quercetin dioxygenase-like cupin family protein